MTCLTFHFHKCSLRNLILRCLRNTGGVGGCILYGFLLVVYTVGELFVVAGGGCY